LFMWCLYRLPRLARSSDVIFSSVFIINSRTDNSL
jgi:hypothetical protein